MVIKNKLLANDILPYSDGKSILKKLSNKCKTGDRVGLNTENMVKKFVYSLLATILMVAAIMMIGYAYLASPSKTEIREYRQSTETTLTDLQIANEIAAHSSGTQLTLIEAGVICIVGAMLFIVGLALFGLVSHKESEPRLISSSPSRRPGTS